MPTGAVSNCAYDFLIVYDLESRISCLLACSFEKSAFTSLRQMSEFLEVLKQLVD